MKEWMAGFVFTLILVVTAVPLMHGRSSNQAGGPEPSPSPFQEGQVFPTLGFPSLQDGRLTSIADFRGKKIILHVFASW